jgi:hypothetical protein
MMEFKMTSTVQSTAAESQKSFAMADIAGGILAVILVAILV